MWFDSNAENLEKTVNYALLLFYTKAQSRQEISTAVEEASGIPNVMGMIDGTHISIRAPVKHPEVYVCRKKFHSINVQVSSYLSKQTEAHKMLQN